MLEFQLNIRLFDFDVILSVQIYFTKQSNKKKEMRMNITDKVKHSRPWHCEKYMDWYFERLRHMCMSWTSILPGQQTQESKTSKLCIKHKYY